MTMRILIFDDDKAVSQMLETIFMMHEYESFSFSDPSECPIHEPPAEFPADTHPCADVILTDVHMTEMNGFDFIKKLSTAGYKPENMALISGEWSDEDAEAAKAIGCSNFTKPFDFDALEGWLDQCNQRLSADRTLSDWFRSI